MMASSCGGDAEGQPGDTVPGGCGWPGPGVGHSAHPASKAAHCPLMLLPGSGGEKPSGACPAEASGEKGILSAPRGMRRSRAWFGGTPRGQQRRQSLNP